MDLKNVLKTLKLNESLISMILGALVILVVGVLTVNYFRNRREAPQPVATQNQQQTPQAAEEGKVPSSLPQTHKVAKGESLWTIAEKYYNSGYNWTDIASANKLSNVGMIEEGQELALPQVEAKKATAMAQATPEATPTQAPVAQASPTPSQAPEQAAEPTEAASVITGESYKVVKGDHLWGIAVRAYGDGYRWVEIARANKLANPNLIFVDQELTLPRTGEASGK